MPSDEDREDNFTIGYKSKRGVSGGHRIPTNSEWTYDQKKLLSKLKDFGLVRGELLERKNSKWLSVMEVCCVIDLNGVRCTGKVAPRSKLMLCDNHKKQYQRHRIRTNVRNFRERQSVSGS